MRHSATYSPEDNKIRIYPGGIRLDSELGEEYASFKAAGFKWAGKQDCFVCPRWTPTAEDWALRLCGEIDDEDYSPEERSADRAERFENYRDNRRDEAGNFADSFDSGPSVFGHQNRDRAERQANRHDRYRTRAVSQWSKAEYWQVRTAGVISHALHRSSAPVRRSRILRLEAEQRKHNATREEYAKRFAAWTKVLTLDGPHTPLARAEEGTFGADLSASTAAGRLAYTLANSASSWGEYTHPRTGRKTSLYSLLTDADPITPAEAAALWLEDASDPSDQDSNSARWAAHYDLRLTYERTMLANEGGTAAEADIEPGGWIRGIRTHTVYEDLTASDWVQVHAVNKSNTTGRVCSVKVMGLVGYQDKKPGLVLCNIERLPEGSYRAPTDEEREAFKTSTKQRKAAEKASKPAGPQLINPTEADAERLQMILNEIGRARHEAKYAAKWERESYKFKPTPILKMTQAQYSEHSKGTYSSFETRTLHNGGGIISRRTSNMYSSEGSAYDKALGAAVCKVRARFASNSQWTSPPHIVVITDKPQKPLPLDWEAIAALVPTQPQSQEVA